MVPTSFVGDSVPGHNSRLRYRRRTERGASLVEYAFIVIIFLSLIFGIGGFGHALFVYHFVNGAAKEATRYAAVRGRTCLDDSSCTAANSTSGAAGPTKDNLSDLTAYVASLTPQSIDSSKVIVTPNWLAPAGSPTVCTSAITGSGGTSVGPYSDYQGCTVQVQVSYPYSFYFPMLPATTTTTAPCIDPGFCLSSTSEMVIAH
jgi:Flp pilus assembly protein TadG